MVVARQEPNIMAPLLVVDLYHVKHVPGPHDSPCPTHGIMPTLALDTAVTHSGVQRLSRTGNLDSRVSRIDTHPVARTTARWIPNNARDPRLTGHSRGHIGPGAYPIDEGGCFHSPPSQEWSPTYNNITSPTIWISPHMRRPICLRHPPRSLRSGGQESQWNPPGHIRPRR